MTSIHCTSPILLRGMRVYNSYEEKGRKRREKRERERERLGVERGGMERGITGGNFKDLLKFHTIGRC